VFPIECWGCPITLSTPSSFMVLVVLLHSKGICGPSFLEVWNVDCTDWLGNGFFVVCPTSTFRLENVG
jgi:hypothetical protein